MTPVSVPDAELVASPTCPLCHTSDPIMTTAALAAGAEWVCTRCGQRWNALRLATVGAYERYTR